MRVHLVSDLHLLRRKYVMPHVEADVTVCAGDVDEGSNGLAWLARNIPDRPVIYVLGNHEYYGKPLSSFASQLKTAARGTQVSVLENEMLTVGGVRFLGCTLWTDFLLRGDPEAAMLEAGALLNDYKRICAGDDAPKRIRPVETLRKHAISKSWLASNIERPHPGPTVIVTHHAPSAESLVKDRRNLPTAPAFASDLRDFIESSQAAFWMHGHVHRFCSYTLGRTRVVCNPLGYTRDTGTGFIPDLVLDV